jgi:hypothetical protein
MPRANERQDVDRWRTVNQKLVGPGFVHDARVAAMVEEDNRCVVTLDPPDGDQLEFLFERVHEIHALDAVGMMLYSIIELPADCRRFVFVNWDDDDPRKLEILAEQCRWRRRSEPSWQTV